MRFCTEKSKHVLGAIIISYSAIKEQYTMAPASSGAQQPQQYIIVLMLRGSANINLTSLNEDNYKQV